MNQNEQDNRKPHSFCETREEKCTIVVEPMNEQDNRKIEIMENETVIRNLIDAYNDGKPVDIDAAMSALKEMKADRDRQKELFTDYSCELDDTKEDVKKMRSAFSEIYELCLPILDSGRYETSDMRISEIALEHKD